MSYERRQAGGQYILVREVSSTDAPDVTVHVSTHDITITVCGGIGETGMQDGYDMAQALWMGLELIHDRVVDGTLYTCVKTSSPIDESQTGLRTEYVFDVTMTRYYGGLV